MTRIILEGTLNGIGFVIGTAIFGLIASGFLLLLRHQVITFVALPVIGILLWLSVWGRRVVKARLERERSRSLLALSEGNKLLAMRQAPPRIGSS
jgi:hypothetical protein